MDTNEINLGSSGSRFRIIWEDEALLVVDKPAGLLVLPDGWDPLAPFLRAELEKVYGRLWVVHRLDRDTSGLLLFARSAEVHRELNRQFEQRLVEKTYHALVEGCPAWSERVISVPLRINVGHSHRTVVDNRVGKAARTDIRVLDRFDCSDSGGKGQSPREKVRVSLVSAVPRTGRTHQIRVHLASCGHPILGDRMYFSEERVYLPGLERLALHAQSIKFHHPARMEQCTFEAAYPGDLAEVIGRLKKQDS
jgi:tRNA pseudouridine32 synthase / 23S rRNA pseudouridine746 synthase